MSSHQLNSAFTARSIADGPRPATAAATLRGMFDVPPGSHRAPARPAAHRLVWARLRGRPRRRLLRPGPAGAARRRGPRARRQRDHHRRDRGADRRPAVPRHRPVGALRGRPDQDHPAALLGPGRLRRDRDRAPSRPGVRPATAACRSRAGPTSSPRPCSSCRPSARWGNYFNQELYGPPTSLPWGIPIDCAHRLADVYPCTTFPERRPASTRCSCTSRSRACVGALVLIAIGYRLRVAAAPGRPAAHLLHLVRPDPVRPRVPARRQLDVLRHPDRADRVARRSSPSASSGLVLRHRPGHPADRPAANLPRSPRGARSAPRG